MNGTGPFMAFPASLLWNLRDVLEKEGYQTEKTLYETGRRTGASVGKLAERVLEISEYTDFIYNHWMENGLGRPVVKVMGDAIILEVEDSSEAMDNFGPCAYSCGYLDGITSVLLGTHYTCTEESCRSNGSPTCKLMLVKTS